MRKKEAKLRRMKETRAAEEAMLASMVLSENGARRLENAVADNKSEIRKKKQASSAKFDARPVVVIEPCDVCIALREVAGANARKANQGKIRPEKENPKLCSKCSRRAFELATATVKSIKAKEKAAAEDVEEAKRAGTYVPDAKLLQAEEAARVASRVAGKDPTNAKRGFEDLEKDLRMTEKNVALAKTPEQRVAALHKCSQLRVAMRSAMAQRDVDLRRHRIERSKKKEKKVEEDKR